MFLQRPPLHLGQRGIGCRFLAGESAINGGGDPLVVAAPEVGLKRPGIEAAARNPLTLRFPLGGTKNGVGDGHRCFHTASITARQRLNSRPGAPRKVR